ncbi:hypothetical protein [Pseudomonas viridiflava]|uniref:hypothetical protein n=1 Tax=Pseudomonas viridiflava TaxID=33069 RepID=UPI000F056FD5|nr:hypothetical protein [Pseudomonas viridiflava]
MSMKRPDKLKTPFIKEAELIDRQGTIKFGEIKPEGVTLVVEYEGMKAGDKVQAWGLVPPNYDDVKIVPDRAISLVFSVPRAYFSRKRYVSFQYFLYGDDDTIIGLSKAVDYAVTDSVPEPLTMPTIREAVGEPDSEYIVVADLPAEGASLLVDYPGIKTGDRITTRYDGKYSHYSETKVFIGAVPVTFNVPMSYFEEFIADGGRSTVHYYAVSDTSGERVNVSRIRVYRVR